LELAPLKRISEPTKLVFGPVARAAKPLKSLSRRILMIELEHGRHKLEILEPELQKRGSSATQIKSKC